MNKPKSQLASLLILYIAFIYYCALYPFHHWQIPTQSILNGLLFNWVNHILLFDIVQNLFLFLPFGLLAGSLIATQQRKPYLILLLPTVASFCVSLSMEVLQSFNPARVPSLLDLMLNTLSGTVGAMLSFSFLRAFLKLNQRLHHYVWFANKNNWWPLFGLATWLVWGIYQLFPLMPYLHSKHLIASSMPLVLFFKGEYHFYADRFFLYFLQGSTLFFAGKLFLKPFRTFSVLLVYVILICIGRLVTVTLTLNPEMIFGCLGSILALYFGQKILQGFTMPDLSVALRSIRD